VKNVLQLPINKAQAILSSEY